jgi:hypothetical protein
MREMFGHQFNLLATGYGDMRISDWVSYLASEGCRLLTPVLFVIGLAVSLLAYRKRRQLGFFILAMYFLLAFGSLTLFPWINRTFFRRRQELPPKVAQEFYREMDALEKKYYPNGSPYPSSSINFPLGNILLVIGVWALAKKEVRDAARDQLREPAHRDK